MEKKLTGTINYEIAIVDGNINLRFDQSNENRLIALEITRLASQELLKMQEQSNFHGKGIANTRKVIGFLTDQISVLGRFVVDKYKDAIPEEKKVKLLKYNPITDKHFKLKK